ncbi:pyrimidine 5'-nucleotidase [Alcaligenaceae bacterium CGII-47]|nr:pyrimidine 5'-nucleotidase [Alcaligenaceae bacterium CGII-47]
MTRFRRPRTDETVWLFDLDNTLHDASHAIFCAINERMGNAVATTLGVDQDTANTLRARYWKRYGATVIGMVRHHGVKADEFLALSHDFEVAPLVRGETGLAARIRQLPGYKVLLTNAPAQYARDVLQALNILHYFDGLWAIDHMNLQGRIRPKPSQALMRQVLAHLRVPARQVILVEDTLHNLKSARRAGLRTAYIYHHGTPFSTQGQGRDLYVDIRVNAIGPLLMQARGVGKRGKLDRA